MDLKGSTFHHESFVNILSDLLVGLLQENFGETNLHDEWNCTLCRQIYQTALALLAYYILLIFKESALRPILSSSRNVCS